MRGDPSPICIEGGGPGVLCLHGFTGTPFEVRPLAEHLGRAGCSVEAPVLLGHCGTLNDLAVSRWNDWYASAEMSLLSLRAKCSGPVALVGFSMGGLLALRLAAKYPDEISSLTIIAPPLRLAAWKVKGVRFLCRHLPEFLLRRGWLAMPKSKRRSGEGGVMENPSLPAFPIRAVGQLLDLAEVTRGMLPEVVHPTLLIHGLKDDTVPPESSRELAGLMHNAESIRARWLEESGHQIFLDSERDSAIDEINDFITRHTK